MPKDVKESLTIINGHANSLLQRIEDINKFLNEIGAIGNYETMGMVNINIGPVITQTLKSINDFAPSINVIIEQASQYLQAEEETKE